MVAGGADDDAEAEDDDAAPLNGVDNDDRRYVRPTVGPKLELEDCDGGVANAGFGNAAVEGDRLGTLF